LNKYYQDEAERVKVKVCSVSPLFKVGANMLEWRVIEEGPGDGISNMAVDRAILTACEAGEVPPTLRLYSWKRPTLTVGYAQDIDGGIDIERCRELGIQIVRRPTGGRALLHHHEVTYSFTAPVPHLHFPSSLLGAYRVIAQALLEGLEIIGVQEAALASAGKAEKIRNSSRSPSCLSSINHWEIEVQGAKLVGSAQRRTKKAFLQHGSILINCDRSLLNSLFKYEAADSRFKSMDILNNRVVTLSECLGREVGYREVLQALKQGFSRAFPGRWSQENLSSCELARCSSDACLTGVVPTS